MNLAHDFHLHKDKKSCIKNHKKYINNSSMITKRFFTFAHLLPDSVIGNTFGSELEESRFDPWLGNKSLYESRDFFYFQTRNTSKPEIYDLLS